MSSSESLRRLFNLQLGSPGFVSELLRLESEHVCALSCALINVLISWLKRLTRGAQPLHTAGVQFVSFGSLLLVYAAFIVHFRRHNSSQTFF